MPESRYAVAQPRGAGLGDQEWPTGNRYRLPHGPTVEIAVRPKYRISVLSLVRLSLRCI